MTDNVIELDARNISNSEVTTWLSCKRQYKYAFLLNRTPKQINSAMGEGTLGHLYYQYYAEARLQGMTHDASMKHAMKAFTEAMDSMEIDSILKVRKLCERYMNFHEGWPNWEILGTEQRYDLKITDTLTMPTRYDLLVMEKHSGKRIVVDFKHTYDFWSPMDHSLNAQLPMYVTVLNMNGIDVHGAALEEIRSRPLGAAKTQDHRNLFKRTYYYPTPAKKKAMLRRHVGASLEIEEFRALTPEQQDSRILPVLNKFGACKYCNFKELCHTENEGGDIALQLELDFTENTYGYNKTIEPSMEDLF